MPLGLQEFSTIFISVLIAALPLLLTAVIASAVLEVFVDKETVARFVPRHPVLAIVALPLVAWVLPMCECGIIVVARRLVKKGLPLGAAITLMLANPIVNPIVAVSTYLAFPVVGQTMAVLRLLLAYVIAVTVGLVVWALFRRPGTAYIQPDEHEDPYAVGCCDGGPGHAEHRPGPLLPRLRAAAEHAAYEFFDIGKYYLLGSSLAALAQVYVSRTLLETMGQSPGGSVAVMMAFAYLVCLCSQTDAFVAGTFVRTFTPGSLLGFMLYGPMTDVRNTLVLLAAFKGRLVLTLLVLITLLVFGAAWMVNLSLGA